MSNDINQPEPDPAIAVSPTDQTSDRAQSDADQAVTVEVLDKLISAREQADTDQTVTVSMLDRLTESSDSLIQSNLQLAAATVMATQRETIASRRFHWKMIALGVITLLTLIMITLQTVQATSQQRALLHNQDAILATQKLILDCSTPGGQCYKQESQRKAAATAAAAACGKSFTGYPAIKACVDKTLHLSKGSK